MKKSMTLLAVTVVTLACCRILSAQQPSRDSVDLRRDHGRTSTDGQAISGPGAIQPTPEMWFYEQERSRYEDPKAAVRRKAEFRAAQREQRIASMQWFGMSNSRPTASVTPLFGVYSPTWAGNCSNPFLWRSVTPSVMIAPKSAY